MSKAVKLDARRLLCPMPVIKVQNLVENLADGDKVIAVCTDPGVMSDIPSWCQIHGHRLLNSHSIGEEYIIELEVIGSGRE